MPVLNVLFNQNGGTKPKLWACLSDTGSNLEVRMWSHSGNSISSKEFHYKENSKCLSKKLRENYNRLGGYVFDVLDNQAALRYVNALWHGDINQISLDLEHMSDNDFNAITRIAMELSLELERTFETAMYKLSKERIDRLRVIERKRSNSRSEQQATATAPVATPAPVAVKTLQERITESIIAANLVDKASSAWNW